MVGGHVRIGHSRKTNIQYGDSNLIKEFPLKRIRVLLDKEFMQPIVQSAGVP